MIAVLSIITQPTGKEVNSTYTQAGSSEGSTCDGRWLFVMTVCLVCLRGLGSGYGDTLYAPEAG